MSSSTSHSPTDIHSYQLQKTTILHHSCEGTILMQLEAEHSPTSTKPLCCAILNKLQSLVLVVLVAIEMDSTQICLLWSN